MKKLNIKIASEIVGGLSKPSKMPSLGISLPASECKTGQKLRKIPGSVCSKCYACKGMYVFPNVKNALLKRLDAISNPDWVDAMTYLIRNKKQVKDTKVFRWHDSGDLQSVDHLAKIAEVAAQTSDVMHWLPTKEKGIVAKFKAAGNVIPKNLLVRVSGAMIDGKPPRNADHTSTVVSDPAKATCRAFENNGECGACRKCWNPEIKNISYHVH